jgi:hypothetical protein
VAALERMIEAARDAPREPSVATDDPAPSRAPAPTPPPTARSPARTPAARLLASALSAAQPLEQHRQQEELLMAACDALWPPGGGRDSLLLGE